MNFLVEPKKGTKWPKELPKFKSRPEAIAVCKDLCSGHFMHRSEKVGKGELEVSFDVVVVKSVLVFDDWLAALFRVANWNYAVSSLVLLAA